MIDTRTSDVCRACFVSVDRDVYYNPAAETVDYHAYVDINDTTKLFDLKSQQDQEDVSQKGNFSKEAAAPHDPDKEILDRIKQQLNPFTRAQKEKIVYVPQQLEEVMEGLKQYVEKTGIMLYDIINIQYGKKLRFKTGLKEAEINLFFGKRGFSVVQSPRCGTSSELNKLMTDLITCYLGEEL